jgi:cytidine deaminase
MRKQNISFELTVFDSIEELSVEDNNLMLAAVVARKKAYAPYSSFQVGAAVRLENGEVLTGNNQENASYPSGLCAERVVMFYAGANFPGVTIKSIAISATSLNHVVDKPAAPCGNCRQSMSEYEVKQKQHIPVLMMGETGEVLKCNSIAEILPLAFDSSYLD